MLEQCNDFCGWTSGIVAALSFGSFGVPIKLISNVKVDPLVMQVNYHMYFINAYRVSFISLILTVFVSIPRATSHLFAS